MVSKNTQPNPDLEPKRYGEGSDGSQKTKAYNNMRDILSVMAKVRFSVL